MLVDEDGVPDFWATLFTSQERRNQTQSSICSCLRNISHMKKWEVINDKNLIEDFENSLIPDERFVESIKEHCGLKSEHIEKALRTKSNRKIVSFNELRLAQTSPMSQVSCSYQLRRMADISSFLIFVGRAVLKTKKNSSVLIKELDTLARTIKANFPKSTFSRHNTRLPHAEKETFEKFLEVFNPESEQNPFKTYDLKVRNYLLVQLLFWTGARSGEILSLTLDDIDYDVNTPQIKIKRTHDDVADSRKHQPVTKTKSREIIIPSWLRDEIDYYISKIRSTFPASKNHPYLFVSHKGRSAGQPITNSTFYNRVIFTVKKIDLEGFKLVKRHGFRHLFNENLSERIDAHNTKIRLQISDAESLGRPLRAAELKKELIGDRQEVELRMSLMGHSSEESSRPYIDRHIKKKARQFHKEMMQDMSQTMRSVRASK